jgi:Tol biopolymer transport system component
MALLLLALVGALIFAGTRTKPLPAPFGPANNGLIAFSDQGDIVALDPKTGQRTVLIGGPTKDALPWFSPDGSRFVFVRGDPLGAAELWAAQADGSNPVKLASVSKIGWVEWSPQSDVIAMTNDVDRSIITMVRADGSGSTVVHTGLAVAENPVWRPVDGRQLAFRGEDTTATWGVYVMDRTGTTPVHLDLDAGFKDDPYYTENFDYYFQSVAWSPDGTKLMYHTLEPDPTSPAGPGFRIHIADIDHSGAVTAERKLEFDRSADDEFSAAWLPTGDGIVYDHLEGTESHLMSADASGTKPARDLGLVGQEWIGFQISPDGHQVISSVTPIAGSEPSSLVTDLASGTTSPITIPSDFAWQRTGP